LIVACRFRKESESSNFSSRKGGKEGRQTATVRQKGDGQMKGSDQGKERNNLHGVMGRSMTAVGGREGSPRSIGYHRFTHRPPDLEREPAIKLQLGGRGRGVSGPFSRFRKREKKEAEDSLVLEGNATVKWKVPRTSRRKKAGLRRLVRGGKGMKTARQTPSPGWPRGESPRD